MSRLKSVLAIAVMIGAAGFAQSAFAAGANLKVMMVGASGTWQALALGTYSAGACPAGSRAGCGHATYGGATAVHVVDTRTSPVSTDTGAAVWIVWDNTTADPTCSSSGCNVWAYVKVDSVVGNRCFFAQPHCEIAVISPGAPDGLITGVGAAWNGTPEQTPPANVLALFSSGTTRVNVAVSEVAPEDAAFAQCRINSTLGGGNDGLNGLGYGVNASGVCPTFASPLANKAGTDLVSSYPSSTTTAHPLAFNISGRDPYTNSLIPAFSRVSLGAEPLVFAIDRETGTGLENVSSVSLHQLQTVFSGTSCNATDLGGTSAGIHVFFREPLSGTFNAAEFTALRLPRDSSGNYALPLSGGTVSGSQMNDWAVAGVGRTGGSGATNPAYDIGCSAGGGFRYQAVGNGDEVKFIQHSNDGTLAESLGGIGYSFFSYGNFSSLKDNSKYGYLQIDGVDPIWEVYGSSYDPGEAPIAGAFPGTADLVNCSGNFPCPETSIWSGNASFPNVRSGAYRQWIFVRLIGYTGGAAYAAAQALVASAQASVVTTVPDFIPIPVVNVTIGGHAFADPGLKILHSHYTQDGVAPANPITGAEAGGDVGGCILPPTSIATKLVYRDPSCVVGP